MMYFVDRDKISSTLQFLNDQISTFESNKDWETTIEKAALERLAHSMIEAVLDVGNAMIDGFIMRDPGSYDDIVDILLDEKVISKEMEIAFKKLIFLRKDIVQDYLTTNHKNVERILCEQLDNLKLFSPKVTTYIETELGPVSAFKR